MQAKQSLTALEMYSNTGSFTTPSSMRATVPGLPAGVASGSRVPLPQNFPIQQPHPPGRSSAVIAHGEGLLHDARNLMGALGLYCDLLSMPGVLKPEHRHYAEEVRLLGTRSAAMIQQLMEGRIQVLGGESDCLCRNVRSKIAGAGFGGGAGGWSGAAGSQEKRGSETQPVSLRMIAERCSGLLRRVSCGRPIEIHYGAAASVPVRVPEEAVERILVNLVRNAAAALGRRDLDPDTGRSASEGEVGVRIAAVDPTADVAPGTIRIGVGLLVNRVGDPKPWPFRRVRLTIEDSGCGMSPEQLERLLCSGRAPSRGSHGIGFQVVRELVEASDGDLRVMSVPGAGTRVQIEWPIAGGPAAETPECEGESTENTERGQPC